MGGAARLNHVDRKTLQVLFSVFLIVYTNMDREGAV